MNTFYMFSRGEVATSKKRGFTLIELLVVISIVSLLSSVIMAPVNDARERSRDLSRLTTLREIRNALENYRNDAGRYPNTNSAYTCFDCTSTTYFTTNVVQVDSVNTTAEPLSQSALITKNYLGKIPQDPKKYGTISDAGFLYRSSPNGVDYCIMSWRNPENMNNFPLSMINTNTGRCELPIDANGVCSNGRNGHNIFFSSGGAFATGC